MPNKLDLDWRKGKKVTFSYKGDCKTTKITNIEGSKNVNIGNSEYSILNMLAMDGFGVGCGQIITQKIKIFKMENIGQK